MPLPALKNRDDGVGAGPIEKITREPDEDASFGMLDAVAEDMLMAFEKKDKEMLKEALSSLVAHIQSADIAQDEDMT